MTNRSFKLSVLILCTALIVIVIISQRELPAVVQTNLERIPMEIGGYLAEEAFFSDEVYKELNADKHLYRHYIDATGEQIDLYIGYYGTAKGGRTPHNPYACLPSQGWGILDTGVISLKVDYAPEGVVLNYVISGKDNVNKYMLHWYQSARTKVLDSGIKRNIQRFLGKIVHNRNDGAYVQVSLTKTGTNGVEFPEELEQFAQDVLNLLPSYWPEEQ